MRIRRSFNLRQTVVAGLGVLTVAGATLAVAASPLSAHAAVDANANPCGTLWSDPSSDASGPPGDSNTAPIDLVSGNMSDNGSSLTTTLTLSSLSSSAASDVPTGASAVDYYMVWGFGATSYYTDVDVMGVTGTITYSYGTYNSTTGFSQTATLTTGTYDSPANSVTVTVPFSDIGSPASGDVITASTIFGESTYSETVSGSGVVFTADKDTSNFDYQFGESCGTGPTPTPTASATPSPSASSSPTSSTCTPQAHETNVSENGFICPVEIPSSAGLGEPTIIHDAGQNNSGVDRLFVIAPAGVPTIAGSGNHPSSPLFTSTDDGLHWTGPVYDTFCAGAAGGDSDAVADPSGNIYTTDLSLANSCLGVSEDHGGSYTAGNPYGTGYTAGDDRPWLAFNNGASEVFGTWDGFDGIHVYNSAPTTVNAATGTVPVSDQIAIPESLINQGVVTTVRDCVCPPGGIAVDNSSAHPGRIYIAFSSQNGEGIGYADPVGGLTPPTASWSFTYIPDIASGGSPFQDEWNFSPIKVDSSGNVYVMWAHAINFSTTADSKGVQEYYAYSTDGGAHFSSPILLSTEDGTDGSGGTTTFPTMDVVSPGVIDAAWYGTTATGDPNTVPSTAQWNVWYTRVTNADTATPTVAAPVIAIDDMHNGCIQTGGNGSSECSDRSLLDFFQLTDDPGSPHIIYTDGDVTNGVNLFFTRLATQSSTATPEVPWAPLLLPIGGIAAIAIGVRRRRRGAPLSE
jgi:hypothetical protein